MNVPPSALRHYLSYDPATGVFRWVKRYGSSHVKVGAIAGSPNADGYLTIVFRGRRYRCSRLAWWFVHGEMPPQEIDHRDLTPSNDRIANLRLATHGQNQRNRALKRNNTSGFKGVRLYKRTGRWHAAIRVDRRYFDLGYFDTAGAAASAYDAAAREHHGEFARPNF